jgi:hypothetical protein
VKCSDARHLIHLSVGDDNLTEEEQSLAEHLHECSECRSYNAGMVDAMQVLHQFRDDTVVDEDVSVWSSVEQRIYERRSQVQPMLHHPQRQFNGGVVALCACSLVLAFVTIVQNLPVNDSMADLSVPAYQFNVGSQATPMPGVPGLQGRPVPVLFNNNNNLPQIAIPQNNTPLVPVHSGTRHF